MRQFEPGGPCLDFQTWEISNLNRPKSGTASPIVQKAPFCQAKHKPLCVRELCAPRRRT